MANLYKGLTFRIGADTTDLNKGIRQAKKEMSGVPAELRKIERALKLDPGNTKLLEQQQEKYRKAISSTEKQLRAYQDVRAQAEAGEIDLDDEQWRRLEADIAACEVRLKGYRSALADSIVQQNAMGSALGRAGAGLQSFGKKLEPVGQRVSQVGGVLTRTLTPAILAAGAASVAAAIDIDDSLTGVRKTVDGTEAQYQALKRAAIEFSQTNAVSASQILDIQALGAQLGYSIDELQEFSEVVSGLDIATNMDADTAATELAQFANIMGMAHDETRNYGSTVVALGNSFATTEADISSMAMRIAGAGKQIGLSEADVLGLATALSSMGIEAEAGGTAVSTIMATIDKTVALAARNAGISTEELARMTKKQRNEIASVGESLQTWADAAGMSADDFAAAWGEDAVGALSRVLVGMDAAVESGGNMSVMLDELGITSIRQTDTMKRLASNSEFLGRAVSKANEAWRENSALDAEVANRNSSLSAQFEMLKNRAVAMAEKFGGPLCRAILDVVDRAEPLIQMLADGAKRFDQMSKSEQDAVLRAVALSAALGPVLSIVGTGMTKVQALGKGMSSLATYLAKAGTAAEGATVTFSRTRSALSLLGSAAKALTLGAVVVALVAVAGAAKEAWEHQQNLAKAARELRDPMASMGSAAREASAGMREASDDADEYVLSLTEMNKSLRDGARAQAEFADSMERAFSDAGTEIGRLDGYADTIERLYGKTGLTAREQMELSAALDAVAASSGQSFELIQDEAGAYVAVKDGAVMAKDAILDLVAAQVVQVRQSAVESQLEEAFRQQAEAADRLAEAHRTLAEAQERYSSAKREDFETDRDYREALLSYDSQLNEAKNGYEEAAEQARNADSAVKALTDETGLLASAMDKGTGSIEALVAGNAALMSSLSLSGKSSADFAACLVDAGVSASDFAKLSDEALMGLAESYDGTFASIEGSLRHNGVAWDENAARVADAAARMTGPALDATGAVAAALADMALRTGTSADDFKRKLAEAGASAEDFNSLTADQLAQLVDSYDGDIGQVKDKLDEFVSMNRLSGAAGGQALTGAVSAETGKLPGIASRDSQSASRNYATSLVSYQGLTRTNALAIADEAAKIGRDKDKSGEWGSHLVQNFASAIKNGTSWVSGAAKDIANVVAANLKHTVPKEGILHEGGEGEARWGRHAVQNYARGMLQAVPDVEAAADKVAAAQSASLAGASVSAETVARMTVGYEASAAASRTVVVTDGAAAELLRAILQEVAGQRRDMPAVLAASFPDKLTVNEREFARISKESKGAW